MKVADTIIYCINYHKINSRPNTLANYQFLLGRFGHSYQNRDIDAITTEEIIAFLANITEGRKQNTKRSRYTTLSAFFNRRSYAIIVIGYVQTSYNRESSYFYL